jgi:hypothetical protein
MQFLNELQLVFGMNSGNMNCYRTHESAGQVVVSMLDSGGEAFLRNTVWLLDPVKGSMIYQFDRQLNIS